MPRLSGMDMDMYIVSADLPEEQRLLFEELTRMFGESLIFISDPGLNLIDRLGMKNGDVAYRGYAILDSDGTVALKKVNDRWGEEFEKTFKDIEEAYRELTK